MTRIGSVLPALLLSLVACSSKERPPLLDPGAESGPEIPYERLPETSAAFEERDCPDDFDFGDYPSQCGTVTVPESVGSKRHMKLAVLRVFSNAKDVQGDAVVYLNGGPGGATLASAGFYVETFEPLLSQRDLVFVDQRGTGESTPSLDCTESGSDIDAALDACFERLSRQTDLSATTSVSNARDIELVRQALGYEQWNLFGISYGTRLGLTIARDYPAGVRSLVVDSVVPLEIDLVAGIGKNGQDSFELVFAACQADLACAKKYPDSMKQLRDTTAQLDAEPIDGVNGSDFIGTLFQLLYSPEGIELVPYLINQVAQGDVSRLRTIGGKLSDGSVAFGMHLSLHCAEEVPFTSQAAVTEADAALFDELRQGLSGDEYFEYCAHWPVAAAPPSENEAVLSAVPSLVLAGKFDPITPPENAALVHESLSNSQFFTLEGESHGASTAACGLSLVQAFFDAPTETVPSTCVGDLPDLEFKSMTARNRDRTIAGQLRFFTAEPSDQVLDAIVRDVKRRR